MTDESDMQAAHAADEAAPASANDDNAAAGASPPAAAPPPKPLASYQGNDLAGLLNDLGAKLTGSKDLPHSLRWGEAGAAAVEEHTGHSSVSPTIWFAAASLVLIAAWFVRRGEAPRPLGDAP